MAGFVDNCVFRATSGGTANFVVASAITGGLTPANAGAVDGVTYRYRAESDDKTQWEIGSGAVSSTTLARTTIHKSTNGNAVVNFSAPPKVRLTFLSADVGVRLIDAQAIVANGT